MGRPVDTDGNELFLEYPKRLEDGYTAQSAEDEAAHLHPPKPEAAAPVPDALEEPEGVPAADPLDDVSIEMDNPAFNEPPTRKAANKKK